MPVREINNVYRVLRGEGFKDTQLSAFKGERYSLVKKLEDPWELHVRIYDGGFLESEVEVSREYVEHLGEYRIHVIYEAYSYYSKVYDKLHILYKPSGRYIVKILDHVRIRVRPPKTLTPWKPIAVAAGLFAVVGSIFYALSKLEKVEGGEET